MDKQDKLIFGIAIVWFLIEITGMLLNNNESNGDSKINGYPQEFYDTTR